MSSAGSVTYWVGELKAGNHAAAQALWQSYFDRLVGLARKKLHGASRRTADEEDVALSAFDSFCRGAAHGRFPQLFDRDDLWGLLIVITSRKAIDLRLHQGRQKRGGGAVLGESSLPDPASSVAGEMAIEQIVGREPTPEFAAQVAEECQRLLGSLTDPTLRSVALWKMEGYTNEEIAAELGCVPRTVERKLRLIRHLWSEQGVS
jgi:DNA-directed RNA polymerase specialized sigma24 family protein